MSENKTFKVEWVFNTVVGSHRGDYLVRDLEELLRILNKSEGVNRTSCKYICVHEILPNGRVMEVYDYDERRKNVINIVEANLKKIKEEPAAVPKKPRVRMKNNTKDTVRNFVTAGYGRYKAYEAT